MDRTQKILLGVLFASLASVAQAQSTTTGAIQGTVLDEASNAAIPIVTVTAKSPSLQGSQTELTDDAGFFQITNLPPGTYSVDFDYGGVKVTRENIIVYVGKTTTANAKINTAKAGETIVIKAKAPAIDASSSKQGTTIGEDYMKNVPGGRTYEGVLGAAPGSQGDSYGVSFSGSTSVENNYVVDGINTTGLTYGTVGSELLNNFIQEIEVITGGYNAEFGRSTGGVVNVVTKSGSNKFSGSVFFNFTPFRAQAKKVFVAGSSIDAESNLDYSMDFGFDVGGPIIKDKLWFYVGFSPAFSQTDVARIVGTAVDRRYNRNDYDRIPDPDDDTTTIATPGCELHPTVGGEVMSCESDGRADLDPETGFAKYEEIQRSHRKDWGRSFQVLGKLTFAANPNNQGAATFIGSFGNGRNVYGVAGTPLAMEDDSESQTVDTSLKWLSKFLGGKGEVEATVGLHRNDYQNDPIMERRENGDGGDVRSSSRIRVWNIDPAVVNLGNLGRNNDERETDEVLRFCSDTDPTIPDQFPSIVNCPITSYSWNSRGWLEKSMEQRVSASVKGTYRLKLLGSHTIMAGGDFEDNTLEDTITPTGGRFVESYDDWEFSQYVRLDETGSDACGVDEDGNLIPCTYLDGSSPGAVRSTHGETFNWAAYARDSWAIKPNLTVNYGLRYEQQGLKYSDEVQGQVDPVTGEAFGENAMDLRNLWAPRVGVTYDWTKEGRSKVYAHYGRYYESIPMDINTRAFGGEVQYESYWDWYGQCGTGVGPNDPPDLPSMPNGCPAQPTLANLPANGDYLLGAGSEQYGIAPGLTLVVPGTEAQYLSEYVGGVEYEILEDLRLGLNLQYRHLSRVIEDMSTDGANTYIVGNPGEFSEEEEDALEAQIAGMTPGPLQEQLQARLDMFRQIRSFDRPIRNYYAVGLTATKRFSRNFMLQGSFTWSRTEGNYPGLFSPDTDQLDPNITSQYDLFELLANRYGRLPHDQPLSFKLDGAYSFDLKDVGRVTTGARLRLESGEPIDTLGRHQVYGSGESYILPRGIYGRTDTTTSADLRIGYERRLPNNMGLLVTLDLFNVFNYQPEASVDEEYTRSYVNPIVGGSVEDLPYLKIVNTGNIAVKRINYANTSSRVAPTSVRLGVTLTF